jgi:general secretion pathway protein J
MMNSAKGFTLLELLIALALFSLLALGCWRLFDSLVRAERQSSEHAQQLRQLQRAVAVIERDLLHVMLAPGIRINGNLLNLQRLDWRNPLDQPRSEWQEVTYSLEGTQLWRYSRGDSGARQNQRLLDDVRSLRWQVLDAKGSWQGSGGIRQPRAVELLLDTGRYSDIRRLLILAQGAR